MTRVTQEHVDARRDAILSAGARLFARKGFSNATMADIAAEADLSAGAIYRYFSSKEELLRAVFDEAVARNQRLFQEESEETRSPLQALVRVGRRAWIEMDDRDSLICEVQMALAAARDPDDFGVDLTKNRQIIHDLLEQKVREAQAAGEIDPNADPAALTVILEACTSGIQMMKLQQPDQIELEPAFNLLVQMVAGLRVSPEHVDGR